MNVVEQFRKLVNDIEVHPTKEDFVKLYLLLEKYDLNTLIRKLNSADSCSHISYNEMGILKAFVYFRDVEEQPMPRMHREIEWEQVKERMREVVKAACLT